METLITQKAEEPKKSSNPYAGLHILQPKLVASIQVLKRKSLPAYNAAVKHIRSFQQIIAKEKIIIAWIRPKEIGIDICPAALLSRRINIDDVVPIETKNISKTVQITIDEDAYDVIVVESTPDQRLLRQANKWLKPNETGTELTLKKADEICFVTDKLFLVVKHDL